jgi:hypothetical protein
MEMEHRDMMIGALTRGDADACEAIVRVLAGSGDCVGMR